MQTHEERSAVYTLILGVCMLLSLLLIGKMLLGHPASTKPGAPPQADGEGNGMEIQLNEDELCALVVQALPFEPEEINARIGDDGMVSISALVNKQTLADSGVITGGMRTALLFLPEECEICGKWQLRAENNTIELDCRGIEAAGVTLPDELANSLSEKIADVLTQQLQTWQIDWTEIVCKDGVITVK